MLILGIISTSNTYEGDGYDVGLEILDLREHVR